MREIKTVKTKLFKLERRHSLGNSWEIEERKDACIQTENEEGTVKQEDIRDRKLKIKEQEENILDLVNMEWTESCHKSRICTKSILELDKGMDIAVFVDVENVKENRLINLLTAQSSVIRSHIRAGKFKEGETLSYRLGGTITLGKKELKEDKQVLLIGIDRKKESPTDVYSSMSKLITEYRSEEKRGLHVVWMGGEMQIRARKIMACCIAHHDIDVTWHQKGDRHASAAGNQATTLLDARVSIGLGAAGNVGNQDIKQMNVRHSHTAQSADKKVTWPGLGNVLSIGGKPRNMLGKKYPPRISSDVNKDQNMNEWKTVGKKGQDKAGT
ncbi:hypothetical protein WA026_022235 [Henosepilachna vigintioctopunctata]|uniref:Uncharacterized protein n=1 Tax=Henosepilachna vigintioctopunctata TaxID=420089 RepID=A0AAW1UPC6_9CUCU